MLLHRVSFGPRNRDTLIRTKQFQIIGAGRPHRKGSDEIQIDHKRAVTLYKTFRLLQLFSQLLERDAESSMLRIALLYIDNIGVVRHALYINDITRADFQKCIQCVTMDCDALS